MNVDHVRTFLEIAATGNFNRAAERLNITQSTVSARIKALEERLDRRLFGRGRNGVEMTHAGRQFHRYAVTMVRAWEQARQEVALPEGYRTTFGLGAQNSLWERLLLRWIPWMRERAPDVALRLEADYSPSLMRQLSDGLIDVGVMYEPRTTPGLAFEQLLEERLIMVSTDRRAVSQGWVADYVHVDWGKDVATNYKAAFPEAGTAAVNVGLGAIGLHYIVENGGSGYFPLRVVRPLLADKVLHRVPKAPMFRRRAYLVYAEQPADPDLLDMAVTGLRQIALTESET